MVGCSTFKCDFSLNSTVFTQLINAKSIIYNKMKPEQTSSSLHNLQPIYKPKNDVIRNFQQLLKLKLMREQRKKVVALNFKQIAQPLSVCGSGGYQQPSIKKSFQLRLSKRKNSNHLPYENNFHSQINSSHIRAETRSLVAKSKPYIERYKQERWSLSHRNHILSHLEHVHSFQQKYLRSKQKLVDQKITKLKKRSAISLQPIGSGIQPLTPQKKIVSLTQLRRLSTQSREEAGVQERQISNKSLRYNDIPISEFLYENSRKPAQANSGIQSKIKSICRSQEEVKQSNYQNQRQVVPT